MRVFILRLQKYNLLFTQQKKNRHKLLVSKLFRSLQGVLLHFERLFIHFDYLFSLILLIFVLFCKRKKETI